MCPIRSMKPWVRAVEGTIAGRMIKAGSRQLVCGPGSMDAWAVRALRRASWRSALSVFVSVEGRVIGAILLGDELRRETPRAVQSLRTAGVRRIVMVTGDRAEVGRDDRCCSRSGCRSGQSGAVRQGGCGCF